MSEVPESTESLIESMRRNAAGMDDYALDVAVAETVARRDVAVAHGFPRTAETSNSLLIELCNVRDMRFQAAREIEALMGPMPPEQPC